MVINIFASYDSQMQHGTLNAKEMQLLDRILLGTTTNIVYTPTFAAGKGGGDYFRETTKNSGGRKNPLWKISQSFKKIKLEDTFFRTAFSADLPLFLLAHDCFVKMFLSSICFLKIVYESSALGVPITGIHMQVTIFILQTNNCTIFWI